MEYDEKDRIDPEELNSCDKSESDLDTDKMRTKADPENGKIVCVHCDRWIDSDEWEQVDLGKQMTGPK